MALHDGRKPINEEEVGGVLETLLEENEQSGDDLARFPGPVHIALFAEYQRRFGSPPASGEDLPAFARLLLAEHKAAVRSASKSALASFKNKVRDKSCQELKRPNSHSMLGSVGLARS